MASRSRVRERPCHALTTLTDASPAVLADDDLDIYGIGASTSVRDCGALDCAPRIISSTVRDTPGGGASYTVLGQLRIQAPAEEVYALLTDYARCHHVFKNIASSEVLRTDGGELEVVQNCKWAFLAFSGTFKVHLGVREDPDRGILTFSLVQSNFMNDFEGRWCVRPGSGEGGPSGAWCEVEHSLSVVPSVPVPAAVAYYTRGIFVRQVESILRDLQEGMASRPGGP
ncbi:hypothetical protein TSOC_010684 [Tetrabaena socialis]|uniref:Coenzyme Q-binding protein COQ10 START domain-containing protein n=1 Tax=Tetrabaena socialis TaxID=47790 RepID=A0A2J7ZSM0_9CHLO|nr:hypothetical protein TSOC_010684 [Tetrabaena socialis]|eukprot:PNH03267.1 hypothetical protein TSOC_010684 [Tetrabaena socialis]